MQRLLLGGLFGPMLFALVVVGSALMRQEYSHMMQFVSELGATNTPNAALMNYLGFALGGLLILLFGVGLQQILPQHWTMRSASIFVILFGLGIAVSGIISCDAGCPQGEGTIQNIIHNLIGPITLLCLIIAATIFGFGARNFAPWRSLWRYSMFTALMGFTFFAMLARSLEPNDPTGLWQRLLLAILFLWCAVLAVRAFRFSQSPASNP